ncbi:carbohydrate ABC transporter permease [Paenibacillus radicis (ex Xue et al. 2023)]|uniref:Carbohydrate ABC transporter permease n=1 Tax=Paenibacillus radicis (ex Xue et al. 2023) TaxID=2972489 RepID=A0ABT1YDY1_9BACL|nr:carbohydrate ABC transporter permease [Paenibacillus radicis (ex Xue et al. 2023)]MCR8630629.1 carbohydrate ABC transporter permease [Paenibacillus radicis (ex Xue et al. 2023)]
MRKRKIDMFEATNNSLLILLAIICVYPFLNILAVSVSDGLAVITGKVYFWPIGFNVETYKYVLGNSRLGISLGLFNSIFYTGSGTLVAVLLTFVTAYALSRKRLKGRYFIMLLFLFTWIFEAGLIPSYLVNNTLGLVNSRWIMILPGAISTFLLIITRSFLDAIPGELEESAFIDGANELQMLTRIFFPLSTPVLATIGVFYAVHIWNAFMIPLIYLQDRTLHPIQLILYRLIIKPDGGTSFENLTVNGHQILPDNIEAATIFLAIFPILFVYPFAQKYFTKGMLLGSLKG